MPNYLNTNHYKKGCLPMIQKCILDNLLLPQNLRRKRRYPQYHSHTIDSRSAHTQMKWHSMKELE